MEVTLQTIINLINPMNYKVAFLLILISSNLLAQSVKTHTLAELINTKEPGWELVSAWIKEGKNKIEVLPKVQPQAEAALLELQVTTRSPMGAIIYETGGILVDHGWIRILGSGSERLNRSIMDWNQGKSYIKQGDQLAFLLIADDVVGGFYAINNGALGQEDLGKVFYFAPESLSWQSLGIGYSDFLSFCFSGDLEEFYKGLRWKNWKKDVNGLDGTKGFSFMPFLWTKEGKDINNVSRKAVPIEEIWDLYIESKKGE